MDAMANTAARGASLQEELTRQWDMVEDVSESIKRAGYVWIDWVDETGYVKDAMEVIAEKLPPNVSREDMDRALPLLQERVEPPGLCA